MIDNPLSVTELNNFIRDVLTSGFPKSVWVCGEIQELREKNRHLYFTLAEKDEKAQAIVAKIGVSIWANTRNVIESILSKAENPFQLKDDIQVKLLCRVDFYPPFGQIRLIVESIDPIYTLGKIAQDRLKLIAQLKAKGILDLNKRLELPRVPLNIGLITSHESAAYHDFIDELRRSNYAFKVFLCDAVMQGKNAQGSVVEAINRLERIKDLDVLIITRGGGAVAELSCFDSELIANAIAHAKLPMISGIGHEINTTVTDLAAHTYMKTPTATAQFLVNRIREFVDHVKEKEEALFVLVNDAIANKKQYIRSTALTLQTTSMRLFKRHHERISRSSQAIHQMPINFLKVIRRNVSESGVNLKKIIQLRLLASTTKIESYKKLVEAADPVKILKRGFTLTRRTDGKIIKSIKDVKSKDVLMTQVSDGVITSFVKE